MNFMYIDLGLLLVFCIFIAIFLRKNRKKLKKEGIFLLYKTKIGLRFIESFSKKYKKPLKVIAYISITFGYFAMVLMIVLLIYNVVVLAKMPEIITAPPIMPIIPYAPQIFKIPGLPDFYFIHWILILLVLAITHEFAHGIFARLSGIKIKSTGFGFLGPIIMAFVEQDEKQMVRRKKKDQLAMLSAGPFSNFVFCIIFSIIFLIFMNLSVVPTTPYYAGTIINSSQIESFNINGQTIPYAQFVDISKNEIENLPEKFTLNTDNETFVLTKELFSEELSLFKMNNDSLVGVYYNSPFINADVKGEIMKINGISSKDPKVFDEFKKIMPYQQITIETTKGVYEITADKTPTNESKGFIGLAYAPKLTGFLGKMQEFIMPQKNVFMAYGPRYNVDIYYFLWSFLLWLVILLFAVATFNMLPFAFLDGGRFFYLTALAITKKKKSAELLYKIASVFIILILVVMMLVWAYRMWLYKIFI